MENIKTTSQVESLGKPNSSNNQPSNTTKTSDRTIITSPTKKDDNHSSNINLTQQNKNKVPTTNIGNNPSIITTTII